MNYTDFLSRNGLLRCDADFAPETPPQNYPPEPFAEPFTNHFSESVPAFMQSEPRGEEYSPDERSSDGAGESGVWIPLFMITELKLCGTPLLVYALIYSFTVSGKEYWGSRNYLAERVGCSVSTVDRALRKLEKMGLINERQKAYGRNIYVALPRDGANRR